MKKSKNFVKFCSYIKCNNQADILLTFSNTSGLGICSYALCTSHASTSPFNIREDIVKEEKLGDEDNV